MQFEDESWGRREEMEEEGVSELSTTVFSYVKVYSNYNYAH